jgi:hypothetical protein
VLRQPACAFVTQEGGFKIERLLERFCKAAALIEDAEINWFWVRSDHSWKLRTLNSYRINLQRRPADQLDSPRSES